jgi:hypothetical protein
MERDVHMVPNGSSEASSGDKTIDVDLNSVTCSTDDSVTYVGNSCQQLAVTEIQRYALFFRIILSVNNLV